MLRFVVFYIGLFIILPMALSEEILTKDRLLDGLRMSIYVQIGIAIFWAIIFLMIVGGKRFLPT